MKSKITSQPKRPYVFKQKQIFRFLLALLLLANFNNIKAQNALVPFNFTLSTSATTSAGIFTKDSVLVRTLWNNVKYAAGTYTKYWDRKDDNGYLVKDTSFVVRVISNNFKYKWDGGIIGNTSDSITGSSKHRYFDKPNSMAIFGSFAYFSSGYAEGISSAYKFNISKPQNRKSILSLLGQVDQTSKYTATDGKYVYWAGFDPFNPKVSFVYGSNVSDDKEVKFTSSSSVGMTYGRTYSNAIDVNSSNSAAVASGLAVQKNGAYLFVSHKGLNELHVINKATGALVQNISISKPRELCVDMNDNLWMVHGSNSVQKFSVNSNGTLSSATLSITGLIEPTAVAVSPNNYLVLIVDAGTSQQIKAFDNSSGNSIWTLGQAGGYASDPAVTNNKFFFRDSTTLVNTGNFIAFQQDSSFWFGDPGNERLMHFSASRTYIDQIMSMPCTYSVRADPNDPTRVFNDFLEFKVDYSKPLAANNGSWTLIRNWRRGIPANFFGAYSIFQNVITLSNGRTYATLEDPSATKREFIELPASGHVRFTGIKLNSSEEFLIDNDGTLRIMYTRGVSDTMQWTSRNLSGFDNKNNPIWSTPRTIASSPVTNINDPKPNGMGLPAKTNSNKLIVFCPRKRDGYGLRAGYHLGAIKKGSNKWLWKASKSTEESYQGPMPSDGSFDIGNGVEYPGGNVYAIENNIFWNYHGEFWKNSQTNIWNHYADNGLMIGQFGVVSPDGQTVCEEAFPMGAGNAFSSAFVKVDSIYYLYHNDESVHGAVHRWRISGLNTLAEQSVNIIVKSKTGGLLASYFDGNDLNNFNFKTALVETSVAMTTPPTQITNTNNFSTRWTGYIQPISNQSYTFHTNTSKGVRLWVDGNLIINQWNNSGLTNYNSAAVVLDGSKRYTVKMEINGGTASLSWSTSSISKQIIPSSSLIPSEIPDYSVSYNLLEGITHKTSLQNNLYGWSRNTSNDFNINWDNYWNAKTGVRSYKKDQTDLQIKFRKDSSNYSVTRDLGQASNCLSAWKLKGIMNFDENFPEITNEVGGMQLEVLDNQGKVIIRITHEMVYQGNVPPAWLKINGKTIVTKTQAQIQAIINKNQAFTLDASSSGIVFNYANLPSVNITPLDKTANWNKPTSLKINFISRSATNYDQNISFSALSIEPVINVAKITPSGSSSICQGKSIVLTANTASSYLWSNNATTQSITVNTAGSYFVKTKDATGCQVTSAPVIVKVNALPMASISSTGNGSICQGQTVTLSSSPGKSYSWNNNEKTQNIVVNSAGNYTVIVTDSNGCSNTSSSKTVVIVKNPSIKIAANGPTVFCDGKSVNLSTTFMGTYLWSNTNTSQNINVTETGLYFLKGTDSNGCYSQSDSIAVTVNKQASLKINTSGPITFCKGASVTLSSSFTGAYTWSDLSKLKTLKAVLSGSYSFIGTDTNGCSGYSDTIRVVVNPLPDETITASGPITFCEGDSVKLSAVLGLNYLWNTRETTQTITVKTSGTYFSELSNQYKCNGLTDFVDVVVNPKPSPVIVVKNTLLTSSETSGNQWYLNGVAIQNATGQIYSATSLGSYSVEVTKNSCVGTSPAVIISSLSNNSIGNQVKLFSIFPNPNTGKLYFVPTVDKEYTIDLYTMEGKLVYSIQNSGQIEMDLMTLSSGTYIVKVQMDTDLFTQKIDKL
jgi:hypothetical protein